MSETTSQSRSAARRLPLLLILPLAAFLGLATIFAVSLVGRDPQRVPSTLVGKSAPAFQLAAVEDLRADGSGHPVPGFSQADLARGQVSIVNVWASWCTPCHAEHPYLTALAQTSGAPLFGINYKDKPDAARRFLGRYGNPFVAIGTDISGRTAIEWGVTGVPETFIVDRQGRVVLKHTGPITPEASERDLLPAIAKARAAPAR